MNRDGIIAYIAYANRREVEEMVVSLELEKQDLEAKYKDLQKEKRLVEEECERYKKMFSEEKGKSIALYNQNKKNSHDKNVSRSN